MEEVVPHYKVIQKIPHCSACQVELTHIQQAPVADIFVCPTCKKNFTIPSSNWGYVGVLQPE